jgi:hypothetical protein
VVRRDVLLTGLYLSLLGPNYVYVRFRCSRCKRIGEQLVQERDWDPSVLRESEPQPSRLDRQRFDQLGEITPEEVIEFHYALQSLSAEPEQRR